jgi:hypothetical protein
MAPREEILEGLAFSLEAQLEAMAMAMVRKLAPRPLENAERSYRGGAPEASRQLLLEEYLLKFHVVYPSATALRRRPGAGAQHLKVTKSICTQGPLLRGCQKAQHTLVVLPQKHFGL